MTNSVPFSDMSLQKISMLVADQFPEFYKEQGPHFIEFMQAYYEWLEQEEHPIGHIRKQYQQYDIDRLAQHFLNHFKSKYMWGLPPELLGNQRLLQKHILELYRSKGSQQAIRLLFRLLFNDDIEFYVPSYDIFKLSDNTWIQPTYCEVSYVPNFEPLVNATVRGSVSGATATVESYESRYINNKEVHLLFFSNITGEFRVGEVILSDVIEPLHSPIVLGSITKIRVTGSDAGFSVGDVLTSIDGDKPVQVVVSSTYDGTGSINFQIVDGGQYYTTDAVVSITTGANTSGSGAEFFVRSIKDTHPFLYSAEPLTAFANVALNVDEYGFTAYPEGNVNSIIADCLEIVSIDVGTIDTLLVTNPGSLYDGNVAIQVTDPYTSTRGIVLPNGKIAGTEAVITGEPIVGEELINEVTIQSSGYGMQGYDVLSFASDDNKTMTGFVELGGVGKDVGFYLNTKSFLSDDKYLFDGHYYQDFSYVIKASYTIDKYIDILRNLVHPAGNAVYGDIRILESDQLYNDAVVANIMIAPSSYPLWFSDVDGEDYIFTFDDLDGNEYVATVDHDEIPI